MYKRIIHIIFIIITLLNTNQIQAQSNLSKVRAGYAESLYLIYQNVIPSRLNSIIKTYQSFGDPDVVNQMILESIVFDGIELYETDTNKDESIYEIKTLSKSDSFSIKKLPQINQNCFKIPANLVFYAAFGQTMVNKSSFLEEFFNALSNKNDLFPHMPDIDNNKDFYNSYLNWYLSYPDEMSFFHKLYLSGCEKWNNKTCDEKDIQAFQLAINKYVIEESFYKNWLPDYLESQMDISTSTMLNTSEDLMKSDLQDFINQAFLAVLERRPSDKELEDFKIYIIENKDVTARMVYLALLMIKNG